MQSKSRKSQGGGRPTSFREEFTEQARKLCLLGATDIEVADFFGVEVRTVYRWKNVNAEFCQALKAGKAEADEKVERALFQRATGYEREAVKIFLPRGASKPVYASYREAIPPDTTACICWLKNRKPAEWRDRVEYQNASDPLADLLAAFKAEHDKLSH